MVSVCCAAGIYAHTQHMSAATRLSGLVGGQSNAGAAPGFMISKRKAPLCGCEKKQPTGWLRLTLGRRVVRCEEGVVGGGLLHLCLSDITMSPQCALLITPVREFVRNGVNRAN